MIFRSACTGEAQLLAARARAPVCPSLATPLATALQDSRAKERKRIRVRTKRAYRKSLAVQAKKKIKPTKGTSLDAPLVHYQVLPLHYSSEF